MLRPELTRAQQTRASKTLSWLLRHGANERGLAMDSAGWAAIDDVLDHVELTRAQLDVVVAENTKRRLQVDGDRIRCSQGHSLAGTPVTREALEASWETVTRTAPLYHGTRREVLEVIRREGLRPMDRTHVHLADSPTSRVGKRAAVEVLLEIAPTFPLWLSPNGVYLARAVPPDAIVAERTP